MVSKNVLPRRLYHLFGLCLTTITIAGCGSGSGSGSNTKANVYVRTNLLSNIAGYADSAGSALHTDPNLKNPWGITYSPSGPFWISNNNSGTLGLYDGSGNIQGTAITIAGVNGSAKGTPTGQVYNGTSDFGSSLFIACTEDGAIISWYSGSAAVIRVNDVTVGVRPVYKGLAIGNNGSANYLYAANFSNGRIDVFDGAYAHHTLSGTFVDPSLPAGYAPYNIQNFSGKLYVTYALQDGLKHDSVSGAGRGLINIFDMNGNFLDRLVTGSAAGGSVAELNAPWGLAVAPSAFGPFGSALLVGNFGDGKITAINSSTGAVLGQMKDSVGNLVSISGLWGLMFGNGGGAGSTNTLYFSAGINGEADGLFGSIASGS